MTKLLILLFMTFQASAKDDDAFVPSPTPEEITNPAAFENVNFDGEESAIRKMTQPFIYERDKFRDPFQLPELPPVPLKPGLLYGPFLELQEVPLDQIEIRAIFIDPVKSSALVGYKNFEGKEQMIKVLVGDPLGENFGVVQAIRNGKVIILQTLEENGEKSTTTKTLSVRK